MDVHMINWNRSKEIKVRCVTVTFVNGFGTSCTYAEYNCEK